MRYLFLFPVLLCFSVACYATTANIPGASINPDDRSLDYRASYQPGEHGRGSVFAHRIHYQYAHSDSQRSRIVVQQSQREGSSIELAYTRIEHQWQYRKGTAPGALRFDLQLVEGDNEPHFARVAWIRSFDVGGFDVRGNFFVDAEFGKRAGSGLGLASRVEVSRSVGDQNVGLQLFSGWGRTGDLAGVDRQDHRVGPFLRFGSGDWRFFASYLAGVSDRAADDAVRLFVTVRL